MKIRLTVFYVIASLFAALPAWADMKLVCQMTDYAQGKVSGSNDPGGSDFRLDIKSHVPPKATHLVKGDAAILEDTGAKGAVWNKGTMLQLDYTGHSPYFGALKITYTYRFADKSMSATTLLQRPQNAGPVGPIRGHCTEYW